MLKRTISWEKLKNRVIFQRDGIKTRFRRTLIISDEEELMEE